jgi:predicted lipoprotein with Yx(FWY)xxD motif
MTPGPSFSRRHRLRSALAVAVGTAGFATAALVAVALAKTFTINTASNAKVTNASNKSVREGIAINSKSLAVYTLSGDSRNHPECTKADKCFQFWFPVKVNSAKKLSKAPQVKGSLGTWKRNGFIQVTLGGHPLYTFIGDTQKKAATGEGIKSFGGTWHVVKAGSGKSSTTMTSGTSSSTTMSTTSTYTVPGY